jgi:hypothetical protein
VPEHAPQLAKVRHLQQLAQLAYTLAQQVHDEVVSLRQYDPNAEMTPVDYALGICLGDSEIAANRLGGLRNELESLSHLLADPAREPTAPRT